MLLLRLLALFLGGLTGAAVLVLSRLALGLPLLGALGGRAGGAIPALPSPASRATFLAAALAAGSVAGWMAPDRPVAHALALALLVVAAAGARLLVGPAGGPGAGMILGLGGAVLLGGGAARWLGRGAPP